MIRKLIEFIIPPNKWRFRVGILSSVIVGIVIYTLYVSKFHSYLSDSPEACINCHIMNPQYATWQTSSHKGVANCNDCHVPHNNVFNKYFFKAKDGMRHATLFTLRMEHQVIQIQEAGAKVVQQNCERCHSAAFSHIKKCTGNTQEDEDEDDGNERKCWECHRETPHGKVTSLSSTPFARMPSKSGNVQEWLIKLIETEEKNNKSK